MATSVLEALKNRKEKKQPTPHSRLKDLRFSAFEIEVRIPELMNSDLALASIIERSRAGTLYANVVFDNPGAAEKIGASMHDAGFYHRGNEISEIHLADNAVIGVETQVGMVSFFVKSDGTIFYTGMLDSLNVSVQLDGELIVHQPAQPIPIDIFGWLQHQSVDAMKTDYIIPFMKNGLFTGVTSRATTGNEGYGRISLQFTDSELLEELSANHSFALFNQFQHQNLNKILIAPF